MDTQRLKILNETLKDPLHRCKKHAKEKISPLIEIPVPLDLYHYTNSTGLQGIITENKIRATDIKFMNDATETTYAFNEVLKTIVEEKKDQFSGELQPLFHNLCHHYDLSWFADIYSVSFSEAGDDTGQWRAYSGVTGGYAVNFDLRFNDYAPSIFSSGARFRKDTMLIKLLYDKDEQKNYINEVIDLFCDSLRSNISSIDKDLRVFAIGKYAHAISFSLLDVLLRCKNMSFENEQEWRLLKLVPIARKEKGKELIKYRAGNLGLIPYVEVEAYPPTGPWMSRLPITEVVQGPTSEPELRERSLRGFLKANGYGSPLTEVTRSRVPLRY